MGYYLHYCLYCDNGRNEKHDVTSHYSATHGFGEEYFCSKKEGFKAVFYSLFSSTGI